MKVGDLVKPGDEHGLKNRPYRKSGVVVNLLPAKPGWNEACVVFWNDGDYELEVPAWLEIINAAR
jgi:hypothetical protein